MKFIIAVDCEGPACVVGSPGKALSVSRDYTFACREATLEVNAAARGLFDSGAEEVWVWDSHGQGLNLCIDQLDKRCRLILGKGFTRRFPGLDNRFSGVVMIGYHAMEGTKNAILAHTYSSDAYKNIRANGQTVGEIALDSAVAGEFDVPLIFISSDDKGCREASVFMPWIETVITKQGMGRNCALSKHPHMVQEEIYSGICRAVKDIEQMKPLKFQPPVRLEIDFKAILQTVKALVYRRRGWRPTGPKTIAKELGSMLEWNC
ncbi:peptidase M55 [Desulfobacter hydrogenophilus]|uniref:Peptidase M55 n=1 Tax=Desulfobacter hydrogenophilus TaxID=2291 RepID=A0A328FBG2_9BACT|nr:M55 family metallopeptidase [Desulfobacter hydrogenophilus]NDY73808.1 M55 family metallopeptidase [Desulfobacter hydrogenophilus]QBH13710.1 peptidase M55 [Desulfobacter hydrogenophilus]RAM01898.1 peptidase M55 [Desulfobacter hydrogenophilus]